MGEYLGHPLPRQNKKLLKWKYKDNAFEYDIDFFKDLANYQMTSIEDSKLTKDTLINLLLKHGYTEEQDD